MENFGVSTPNAADRSGALPALTLIEVLDILFVCFEAAIEHMPWNPPIQSSVRGVPYANNAVEVWEYTISDRPASTGFIDHDNNFAHWYRKAHRSIRKQNMCEHFCLFLDTALRSKLKGMSLSLRFPPGFNKSTRATTWNKPLDTLFSLATQNFRPVQARSSLSNGSPRQSRPNTPNVSLRPLDHHE